MSRTRTVLLGLVAIGLGVGSLSSGSAVGFLGLMAGASLITRGLAPFDRMSTAAARLSIATNALFAVITAGLAVLTAANVSGARGVVASVCWLFFTSVSLVSIWAGVRILKGLPPLPLQRFRVSP